MRRVLLRVALPYALAVLAGLLGARARAGAELVVDKLNKKIEERPAVEDACRTHQRHYVVAEQCSMEKVNVNEKLAQFNDQWKAKIVGELNGQQVKLVKIQGPFVWHHHDQEDELFLVVKGRFRMEFRDRHV